MSSRRPTPCPACGGQRERVLLAWPPPMNPGPRFEAAGCEACGLVEAHDPEAYGGAARDAAAHATEESQREIVATAAAMRAAAETTLARYWAIVHGDAYDAERMRQPGQPLDYALASELADRELQDVRVRLGMYRNGGDHGYHVGGVGTGTASLSCAACRAEAS